RDRGDRYVVGPDVHDLRGRRRAPVGGRDAVLHGIVSVGGVLMRRILDGGRRSISEVPLERCEPHAARIVGLVNELYHVKHRGVERIEVDRKSTRLNSSHEWISYAVFCLK